MRHGTLTATWAALLIAGSAPSWAQAPLAAQGCVGCHGQAGAGSQPIPPLAGRPKADIEASMQAFRKNERPASIMGRIARGYTDAEIAAVAAFFAAQKPPGASR
ncbi:MAG: c-type cytochrome [Acetobacteraceae bacterium]|nr:c-type cytochrome [Acetobacteraceae bacterium]